MKRALCLAMLLLSCAARAEYYPVPPHRVFGEPGSEEQERAVDTLMSKFREAWASENATAVAALHAGDAEWTNAFGRIFRGSEALRTFLEADLFPAYEPGISRKEMESYREISRRYLGPDAAVIQAFTESDRGSAVGAGKRRIYFNFVLAKVAGDWRIVHQTISDIRERRRLTTTSGIPPVRASPRS